MRIPRPRIPSSLKSKEWIIAILSIACFSIVAIVFVLTGGEVVFTILGHVTTISWDDFIIFGLIISLIAPSVMFYRDRRRKISIDDNLPNLLRNVSEAGRTGMTLIRAIEVSAEQDYGPLTKEIKKMAAQLSWKVPMEKAIESFADRCDTKLTRRTSLLILEASKTGGDIQESIETVSSHVQSLQDLERRRRSEIRPYTLMIYISFFIFLVTVFILVTQFFMTFSQLNVTGFIITPIPIEDLTRIFHYTTIVEGFFGGLTAGKMSTGSVKYGLKHSVALMAISFIVFNFFM